MLPWDQTWGASSRPTTWTGAANAVTEGGMLIRSPSLTAPCGERVVVCGYGVAGRIVLATSI